jgi:hypothetical protein
MPDEKDLAPLILQAAVFLSLSILCFRAASRERKNWTECVFWATTTGRIIRSEVRRSNGFWAKILYEYTVNNKQYISSNVYLGATAGGYFSSAREKAEKIVAKYNSGEVKVTYNPQKPRVSFLERAEKCTSPNQSRWLGIFLLLYSMGIGYLAYMEFSS